MAEKTSNSLLKKAKISVYPKGKVLLRIYNKLDSKIFTDVDEILHYTPFVEEKNIDRSTLFSIQSPSDLFDANIATIEFLAKSAVDTIYCLFLVDLFTSKTYIYPMKKRNLLARRNGTIL